MWFLMTFLFIIFIVVFNIIIYNILFIVITLRLNNTVKSIIVVDLKTNPLYTARCFIFKHRWNLTFSVASIALGYLIGSYFNCAAKMPYSGTELTASASIEISIELWQRIQTRIDELTEDLQELQAYMNRQKFRVPNTAER